MHISNTSQRELAIVFAADTNFSIPFGIAVQSLLEHAKPETFYDIYVLDDGIRDEVKQEVEQFKNKYAFSITYYDVSEMVRDMPGTCVFPPITYARFLVPKLLPEKVKGRIFYIDADVLFCDDLTELYDMDLEGKPFAATQALNMTAYGNRSYLQWLGKEYGMNFFEKGQPYFHAGEMLFDREAWLEAGFTEACLKMAQEPFPKGILYYDQDFMNIICRGRIANFPAKYCVIPQFEKRYVCDYDYTYEGLSLYSEQELIDAHNKPAIIHYAGSKPIIFRGPAYKNEESFFEAWAKSPWKNRIPYFPRTMITMQAIPERREFLLNPAQELPEASVSVIVHTDNLLRHNTANDFLNCIESIHQQTLPYVEIIVIDNNSTDGTRDLLEKYTELGILRYLSESGIPRWDAYNKGLNQARGKYILFLQATDYLDSKYSLECMVKDALANQSDMVCCGMKYQSSSGDVICAQSPALPMTEYAAPTKLCAALFRTRLLRETEGFQPKKYPHCTEWAFFSMLARKKASCLSSDKYSHSSREDSDTGLINTQQAWKQELDSMLNQAASIPLSQNYEEAAKVAVILPLIQQNEHFLSLLQSIRQQTLTAIQIILVGDERNENMRFARQEAKEDSRIYCINCPPECTYGQAYNIGLNKARAEYVSFITHSDLLTPDFYRQLYDKALENNYLAVKGIAHILDNAGGSKATNVSNDIITGLRSGKRLTSLFNKELYSAIFSREYIARRFAEHAAESNLADDGYFLTQILLHLPASAFGLAQQALSYHRENSYTLSDLPPHPGFLIQQKESIKAKVHYLLSQKEINSPSVVGTLSDIFEYQLGNTINDELSKNSSKEAIYIHLNHLAAWQQQWKQSHTLYRPGTLAAAFEQMGFSPEQFLAHKTAYQRIAQQRLEINALKKTLQETTSAHQEQQNKWSRLLQLHLAAPQLKKKYHLLKLKKLFSAGKRRKKYSNKITAVRAILREYRQLLKDCSI